MDIVEFIFMILAWVIGSILSAIILGLMVDRFILRKVMANEEVQGFFGLFRKLLEYLKEILENQKGKKE